MTKKYLPDNLDEWDICEPNGEYDMRDDIFDYKNQKEFDDLGYDQRRNNIMNHFFQEGVTKVRSFTEYRTHTGRTLAKRLNDEQPELIIDAGCGFNYFGTNVKNCIGIDFVDYKPTHDLRGPDIIMDVTKANTVFAPNCADYIICVGPFNFGPESHLLPLLESFKYLLKPTGRIVGHLRPGQIDDPIKSLYRGYYHMPWTLDLAGELFTENGFNIEWIGEEATDLTWLPDTRLQEHLAAWEQVNVSVSGPPSSAAIDKNLNTKTLERHDIIANIKNEIHRRHQDPLYDSNRPNYIRSRIAIELTLKKKKN